MPPPGGGPELRGNRMSAQAVAGGESQVVPRNPWWAVLLQGIFAVIVGLMLLGVGDITTAQGTFVLIQVIGWYWFFIGMLNLFLLFVDRSMWGWKLFSGIVGILAGLSIIQHPYWATLVVPLVFVVILGIEGLILGVIDIVKGFQGGGWGIGLLGVLNIIIGAWLLAERYVAALALPWAIGVIALVMGVIGIFMSFRVRKEQMA